MSPGLVKMRAWMVSAGIRRLPLTLISEITSVCAQVEACRCQQERGQRRQHRATTRRLTLSQSR